MIVCKVIRTVENWIYDLVLGKVDWSTPYTSTTTPPEPPNERSE